MGMPPLNGFIGEFTILKGAYAMSLVWVLWAGLGVLLGSAYLLWLFQRTTMGDLKEKNTKLLDLSPREIAIAVPFVIAMFYVGLYPKPVFDLLNRPATQIVERIQNAGAPVAAQR
jgi:NADH-quinone oxidoreductase subunit M